MTVDTVVAAIATATGVDTPAATTAAQVETQNNANLYSKDGKLILDQGGNVVSPEEYAEWWEQWKKQNPEKYKELIALLGSDENIYEYRRIPSEFAILIDDPDALAAFIKAGGIVEDLANAEAEFNEKVLNLGAAKGKFSNLEPGTDDYNSLFWYITFLEDYVSNAAAGPSGYGGWLLRHAKANTNQRLQQEKIDEELALVDNTVGGYLALWTLPVTATEAAAAWAASTTMGSIRAIIYGASAVETGTGAVNSIVTGNFNGIAGILVDKAAPGYGDAVTAAVMGGPILIDGGALVYSIAKGGYRFVQGSNEAIKAAHKAAKTELETFNAVGVSGKTVLGHYPEYKQLADTIGARRFNIPEAIWNKMSEAEQWAANQRFLDRVIARGDDIILATPLGKVRPGSFFAKELEYLASKGYRPNSDGTRLIKR